MVALSSLGGAGWQFFDSNGTPLAGGKLYTYAAGTTTPAVTYTTSAGTPGTENTNPIILDSAGRVTAQVWLEDGDIYKFALETSMGIPLWTKDNVPGIFAAVVLNANIIEYDPPFTGALTSGYTVADKLEQTISPKDFGAVSDGVTNDASAVVSANAAAGLIPLVFTGITYIGSPVTITAPISDTLEQIFTSSSQVTISNGLPVRPEWFGVGNNGTVGKVSRACQALPSTGGTVALRIARYQSGFTTGLANGTSIPDVDYLAKSNVSIIGERVPFPAFAFSTLTGGSVIEGPFLVHANGFCIDKVGVDSGINVCNALYGGVSKDGLALYQPNQPTPAFVKDNVIGWVVGLNNSATSATHAVLMEAVDGLTINVAQSYLSGIGTVLKSFNVRANLLASDECGNFSVFLKSDIYAPMRNVSINQIVTRNSALSTGIGLQIQGSSAAASNIKIGSVEINNKVTGFNIQAELSALQTVQIGTMTTDGCTIGGRVYGPAFSRIDNLTMVNATNGMELYDQDTLTFSVGHISMVNITGVGLLLQGIIGVDSIDCSTVANMVRYDNNNAKLTLGGFRGNGITTPFAFSSGAVTIAGTWATYAGAEPYVYDQNSGMSRLRGTVSGGGTGQIIGSVPVPLRPAADVRCSALGYNGLAYAPIEVLISAAGGTVTAVNYTAASTWLSLNGVEWQAA